MYGNFTWWHGVVENRLDPLKLGRCQIRVLGYHTANVQDIPTDELPWATPVQPITSGAMTGVGTTPLGPVEGTWVVGFWRDGANAQEPCFFGTIGGYPKIAVVASVDYDRLVQISPGSKIKFKEIELSDAETLFQLYEMETQNLLSQI